MKTIAPIIAAAILASTLTAHGQSPFAGSSYEVEKIGNYGRITAVVCMTFDQNGRFSMSDEGLSMLWAPRDDFPNQFMAVTAPGERTVVPYHVGVHGTVQPDKTLTGGGIDQAGDTFVFRGRANDDCGSGPYERAVSNSVQAITELTRPHAKLNPTIDPCWTPPGFQVPCDPTPNPLRDGTSSAQALIPSDLASTVDPCSQSHCDPNPNPLRADAATVTTATLTGRSFRLTLGTSDQRVLEYCWTFGTNHEIETCHSKALRWSALGSANDVAGFQSVGGGAKGQGMAYHGALVGDQLLEVVGIEARDGESVLTYGFGQQVSGCK